MSLGVSGDEHTLQLWGEEEGVVGGGLLRVGWDCKLEVFGIWHWQRMLFCAHATDAL